MPLDFIHTHVKDDSYSNYSGTIADRPVTLCEIESGPRDAQALKRHADSVRDIVRHCFAQNPPEKLRTIGSKWSFSKVIEPGKFVIDPGNLVHLARIPKEHFSASYQARAAKGFTPVFVESGTGIGTLNEALGQIPGQPLALQTSGAGNGHRIAGCISTGTHGSALDVGALHDTVLALYIIVGPDQAVFVQRGTDSPFAPSAVQWLEQQTGCPTRHVADDDAFHAAQVSLGSIGFIFGVIVEATKLYRFDIRRLKRAANDPVVLEAIRTLDTSALHPDLQEKPYHFDIVMHPYPPDWKPSWFVTLMWKRSAEGVPFASPVAAIARTSSDTMGLIGEVARMLSGGLFGQKITLEAVRNNIFQQLDADASPAKSELFPGQVFGPTSLPRKEGASTEIAVDQAQALAALDAVHDVLRAQGDAGKFLLGCVAVRFVRKSRALLAMNQFGTTCFIELPSIRNDDVLAIYEAIWAELDRRKITFTCHWGQLGGFTPERTRRYFGDRVDRWKAARRNVLGNDTAMNVFASSILADAGLDG